MLRQRGVSVLILCNLEYLVILRIKIQNTELLVLTQTQVLSIQRTAEDCPGQETTTPIYTAFNGLGFPEIILYGKMF